MSTNFVIFGSMRSGSTALCRYLDSHPEIHCRLELLHKKKYQGTIEGVPNYLSRWIYGDQEKPVRGFKLLYHQMWGRATPGCLKVQEVLKNFGCKYIHLIRGNLLEAYVSHCLARNSKIWNAFEEVRRDSHFQVMKPGLVESYNQPFKADAEDFIAYANRRFAWISTIDNLYPDHYRIYYESLTESLPGLLEFLGVSAAPLACDMVRLRNQPISELITNYDEFMGLVQSAGIIMEAG